MKKRLLCLVLAMIMICSLFLVSCSDEKTEDEIRMENVCKGDVAYTISLWIPTDSTNTDSQEFKDRVTAIQEKMNSIISSTNTKIQLEVIKDSEYDAKLSEKFAAIKAASTLPKPSILGDSYVNQAEPFYPDLENNNTEDYFYKLKFPGILENQIDICLIRDYATYSSLSSQGMLHSLNTYVTSENASYPRFKKLIRNEFIEPLKIGGQLYGLPNNRVYSSDEYQYILINKELATAAGIAVDTTQITNILDCEEIINKIGELNMVNVVPYTGTEKDVPGISSWTVSGNEQSLVVSTKDQTTPVGVLDNEAYLKYTALYKKLKEKNYVGQLADGQVAGVSIFNGTKADAEALSNDYYLVKTATPVMNEEETFSSMFAISEYSINFDRTMSILYLLHTNEELRTVLQYGIKDVDYTLDYSVDEDNPTISLIKDANGNVVYDMNIAYTGNGYITYREEGAVIDDWDYIKSVNYDASISKYLHFLSNYNSKVNEENKAANSLVFGSLDAFSNQIFEEINAMSLTDFEAFIALYEETKEINALDVEKQLLEKAEEYNTLKPNEQSKKDEIAANLAQIELLKADPANAESVKALEERNALLNEELAKIASYDELLATRAKYTVNSTLEKLLTSIDYHSALAKYIELHNAYNK